MRETVDCRSEKADEQFWRIKDMEVLCHWRVGDVI